MSTEALHYVLYRSDVRGFDRLVLIAYADSADAGTGYGFCSVVTLAELAKVSRTAFMDATARLEANGELLVRRPDVRARGRSNQYVVVMGRDPLALAESRGWPRPAVSPTAATGESTATRTASTETPEVPTEAPEAATAPPVDNRGHRPAERSPGATVPRRERSPNGRPMVAPGATVPSPFPTRASASRCSGRARASPQPVDDGLDDLRRLTALRAADVPWHLSDEQRAQARALLAAHGLERLVDVATRMVRERGAPRSASAWLQAWRDLAPPPSERQDATDHVELLPPPCGACDGHLGGPRMQVDADGRPVGPCPPCHPSALVAAF